MCAITNLLLSQGLALGLSGWKRLVVCAHANEPVPVSIPGIAYEHTSSCQTQFPSRLHCNRHTQGPLNAKQIPVITAAMSMQIHMTHLWNALTVQTFCSQTKMTVSSESIQRHQGRHPCQGRKSERSRGDKTRTSERPRRADSSSLWVLSARYNYWTMNA